MGQRGRIVGRRVGLRLCRALDDETERKMALQDMQRALKYIKCLEPKYKKIEREMNKAASG